ncbi:MAG TPA: hypothetical protein VD978_21240 [Azospirillum sp.]|nr:hypothetical protein [Azospirillum sp.]
MQIKHSLSRIAITTAVALVALVAAAAAGAAVTGETVPTPAHIDWNAITETANQLHSFN